MSNRLGVSFLLIASLACGRKSAPPPQPAEAENLCQEHRVPEDECGICHPDLLPAKAPGHGMKVRLPSPASAEAAGIMLAAAATGASPDGIACLAEIAFDQKRVAAIASQAAGTIRSVEVDLGSRVRKGDLLARVDSSATGEARSAYLQALAEESLQQRTYERERKLHEQGIASEKDAQIAEAAWKRASADVARARQHLLVLGFSDARIGKWTSGEGDADVLEVRAPFAGEIVERTAVAGQVVETGTPLLTLADTGTIWAMIDIPEAQAALARSGQVVRLTVDAIPGRTFHGKLTWISPEVDARTRMARGRVEIPNPDGALKARMFGHALIVTSPGGGGLVVPRAAVETIEGVSVVFVRIEDDLYEARRVGLGARHGDLVEIATGLGADEPVVVSGAYALKSQVLISRLGAGCAD